MCTLPFAMILPVMCPEDIEDISLSRSGLSKLALEKYIEGRHILSKWIRSGSKWCTFIAVELLEFWLKARRSSIQVKWTCNAMENSCGVKNIIGENIAINKWSITDLVWSYGPKWFIRRLTLTTTGSTKQQVSLVNKINF